MPTTLIVVLDDATDAATLAQAVQQTLQSDFQVESVTPMPQSGAAAPPQPPDAPTQQAPVTVPSYG